MLFIVVSDSKKIFTLGVCRLSWFVYRQICVILLVIILLNCCVMINYWIAPFADTTF
jgi:hypothetical protein